MKQGFWQVPPAGVVLAVAFTTLLFAAFSDVVVLVCDTIVLSFLPPFVPAVLLVAPLVLGRVLLSVLLLAPIVLGSAPPSVLLLAPSPVFVAPGAVVVGSSPSADADTALALVLVVGVVVEVPLHPVVLISSVVRSVLGHCAFSRHCFALIISTSWHD